MFSNRKKLALITSILVIAVIITSYFFSATSADISISSITLRTDIISALLTGKIEFDVYLEVTGHGLVSLSCKNFSFRIFMGDIYIGNITNTEPFTISAGRTDVIHTILSIDISTLSLGNIEDIINSISGEMPIKIEGWIDVIILVFTIRLPYNKDMVLTG